MTDVREMTPADWPAVRAIYEEGIATGNATFETSAPTWEDWDGGHLAGLRLVAEREGEVIAWAALSPVSDRCAYSGVAENSVYVSARARGTGAGTLVLAELVRRAEAAGIWTITTGILPENEASLALHRRCGFEVVGRRQRLGRLNGRWRDVLLVERRSTVAGID